MRRPPGTADAATEPDRAEERATFRHRTWKGLLDSSAASPLQPAPRGGGSGEKNIFHARAAPHVELVVRSGEVLHEVAAPGPSRTTTSSWAPSGASWSQAARVVSPLRAFISSKSAFRVPFS